MSSRIFLQQTCCNISTLATFKEQKINCHKNRNDRFPIDPVFGISERNGKITAN